MIDYSLIVKQLYCVLLNFWDIL